VLRAIEACLRALRDEETGKFLVRRSDVDEMTEEQLARAQTALASLEKRVADLRRLWAEQGWGRSSDVGTLFRNPAFGYLGDLRLCSAARIEVVDQCTTLVASPWRVETG
jgi:hypothetical protein